MTPLDVDDKAPDFSAPGTGNKIYHLSDYIGSKPVVLIFYPGDATPICTEQLTSYTQDFGQFESYGATVLALSPQDVQSHERFQAEHNFAFPLLYDEDKQIGRLYGVVGPLGFYRRSVFIINSDGLIAFAKASTAGLSYPPARDIIEALNSVAD